MTDRQPWPGGTPHLGSWTQEQADLYARERRLLGLDDIDELNRIVRDSPALVRELRTGAGR